MNHVVAIRKQLPGRGRADEPRPPENQDLQTLPPGRIIAFTSNTCLKPDSCSISFSSRGVNPFSTTLIGDSESLSLLFQRCLYLCHFLGRQNDPRGGRMLTHLLR